jgi:hypothetical protein
MASDISVTTGEIYYSGHWTDIQDVLRVLNIGEGKMDNVNQPMVNRYQEMVDRDIDALLGEVYHTPIRAMNQVVPDGSTKRVFPGDVRRCARYWTAGLLLQNEFQQLAQNVTDQASNYVDDSKKQIYAMKRFNHRILGQERKSQISRTVPPNFQPPTIPEQDW